MIFVGTITERDDKKYEVIYDLEEKRQIALIKFGIGGRVTDNLKKFFKPRTPKQMGYFWGFVLPITSAWMGYAIHERDQCYLVLKSLYLEDVDEKGNKYIKSLKWESNDPVDTQKMSWFTDQVRQMVSMRYGYNIKDPDKYRKEDVNELVREIETA